MVFTWTGFGLSLEFERRSRPLDILPCRGNLLLRLCPSLVPLPLPPPCVWLLPGVEGEGVKDELHVLQPPCLQQTKVGERFLPMYTREGHSIRFKRKDLA